MRLHSLRLQNFRQHADTRVAFDEGLTGIIGPNGSGKSTLLEAIAWALYGNAAARGTRDSIRFTRAGARASVRVELEFSLAGHKYRVVRGLTSAECFLDGGDTPIANTITGVSELLQRRLGMTRAEFFHTYFTGQRELDVMSALGPAERARFLSRVLGYDRISGAQELVRERRRALLAEINGLKQGMPDTDAVWRMVSEAEARIAVARTRAAETEATRVAAAARLAEIVPRWLDAQAERERMQKLLSDLRVAEHEALTTAREVERLSRELDAIEAAQRELSPLQLLLQPLPTLRTELATLDRLAAAEARRQGLLERVNGIAEEEAKLADRASRLESAPALEVETQGVVSAARAAIATIEAGLDTQRTAWTRDRQEAETRLEALRAQYTDLEQQRQTLEGLGEESPCPTCGRPLGASYKGVLELLTEQTETVRTDGNYYRQRVEQLAKPPQALEALEEQRRTASAEVVAAERRLARIQAALAERATIVEQRASASKRLEEARTALAALPMGYDAGRHGALRDEVASLAETSTRAARLGGLVEREPATRAERDRQRLLHDAARERLLGFEGQRSDGGQDDAEFQAVRDAHDRAAVDARRAELEALSASADAARAHGELEVAERSRRELARLQTRLDELELDKRMHDELDRAFSDLRTDLNFQLRPELAEIASGFLETLTDGRYNSLEFDEDYNLLVMEDGVPKPVISGGEEDLCNLVLRLAISQMIAERAGLSFSLLILDEIFGSLDDTRRGNVVELLRRLNDRFEQVIVITHIEQVREGLDRVLLVRFDEARGASHVVRGADSIGEEFDGLSEPVAGDFEDLTPELAL
ncbi:MAG: SMC family ATPase [Gemmatimonadota bacterium]